MGPGAIAEKHPHLKSTCYRRVDLVMRENWRRNAFAEPVVAHTGPEAVGGKHPHLGAAYCRGRLDFVKQLKVYENELYDRP